MTAYNIFKQYAAGFIVGVCVCVTLFHAWFTWQLVDRVNANTQDIAKIVEFIKQATQK